MPVFYDSQNHEHHLTERIGSGGEGTVFVCPRDLSLVAKIYHEPITGEKAEKLGWMAEHKNENLLKVAAWIVDTLRDAPDGKVVGFLMPNVRAKEIHELYSLKSRRVYFPHATWKFLIHTASNLARAFYNLHKNKHIMGDINHGNCVVLADGTVKLIDCDSYSISKGDYRYPCEVGVATHLAPELQKVNLREVKREEKHDNFGLAVIIFQLLFLGRHPFSGNFLGSEDKSLEDCIREGRFAYGAGAKDRWVKQPPGTLDLSAVSPRLALMFERAFLTEDRPHPQEWIEALEDLAHNLKQCAVHPGHYYFEGLKVCPFCEIESQTGLMLFPLTGEKSLIEGEEQFNIFTVENLIASLNIPNNQALALPPKNALTLRPAQTIVKEKDSHNRRIFAFAVAQFLMIVILTAVFGIGFSFMWGVIVLIFSLVYLSNAHQSIRENAEYELESADKEWKKLENEWQSAGTRIYLQDNIAQIRKRVEDYKQFQKNSREQMQSMRDEVFKYKLDLYLNDFKVTDAKLTDNKNANLLVLRSQGIKTAADIDAKRLHSLPRIEHSVAEDLLDWRENLERNFDFDPKEDLPEAEAQKFTGFLSERRRQIEKEIEGLFVGLRSNTSLARQKQQQLNKKADTVAADVAQAKSNLEAVGSNGVGIGILVITTFLTLGIAGAFVSSAHINNTMTTYDIEGGGDISTAPKKVVSEDPLPENLTDEQISEKTDAEKIQMAGRYYTSVLNNPPIDSAAYQKAEKKLSLAARLSPQDGQILSKLGEVYYKHGSLFESEETLKKALKIDPASINARSYLGMTYLRTDKYKDAVKIFSSLSKESPQTFEWQFNLGLSYRGLKNYSQALGSFEAAQKLVPDDVDTINEIAFCAEKLGIKAPKIVKGGGEGNGIGRGSGVGNGTGSGIGNGTGSGTGSGEEKISPPPPPPPPPPAPSLKERKY